MAEESLTLACDSNDSIEYHIVTLFEKIEELRRNNCDKNLSLTDDYHGIHRGGTKSIQVELRSTEFWRAIISECMASFFYVFIVCGAAAGSGVGASLSSVLLATALATGFAMTTLTHCFVNISGAHINPAVTLAMAVTRNVSPIRAIMFLLAQCGGSIAGAAVLYSVTVPKYTGNLSAAVAQTVHLATWERFGVEFVLTFIIVFTYFVSMDSYRYGKHLFNSSALTIGAAYTTCTFVSMPYLNPARSLGPSFVLNKWDNHWVYWFGPMVGGVLSGLIYEFIFHSRRRFQSENTKSKHHHHHHRSIDGVDESSTRSMPSCDDDDEHDNYDDLEKAANLNKYHGSQHGAAANYNTYRGAPPPTMGANINVANAGTTNGIMSTIGGINYLQNSQQYGTTNLQHQQQTNHQSTNQLNRVESIYGGTKSLYCKSPPLTRANLNRSQSVYTKSNCNINLLLPRSGPLIPAQSMYPIRIVQQQQQQQQQSNQQQPASNQQQQQQQIQLTSNQAHVQNQNVQNQIQQQSTSNQQSTVPNQQQQQQQQQIQQVNRTSDPNYGVLPLNLQNTLVRQQQQQQQQQQQNQQSTNSGTLGGSNTNYNTIEMIRPSPPPPLPPPSSSSSTSSTTITMRDRDRDRERDPSSYHHHYHQQQQHHHQINRSLQQQQQQQQQQQCNTLPQYK